MKMINSRSGIVRKMRSIRDEISMDIIDMDLEQENEFIKTELAKLKMRQSSQQHTVS